MAWPPATLSLSLSLTGLSKCLFFQDVDSLYVIFIKQPADVVRDGSLVGLHGHTSHLFLFCLWHFLFMVEGLLDAMFTTGISYYSALHLALFCYIALVFFSRK
jgi:hypothetical protein